MSTLAFGTARIGDVWDEAQPLLEKHWREIAFFEDIALAPRREAYDALDHSGVLRVFTARDGGRLIGYAAYIIGRHMHYASSLQAIQDVLFLLPAYRNVGNGAALITYTEDRLRLEGVQCVAQHVKLAHDFGPLLRHLGYSPMETIHVKRLDQPQGA